MAPGWWYLDVEHLGDGRVAHHLAISQVGRLRNVGDYFYYQTYNRVVFSVEEELGSCGGGVEQCTLMPCEVFQAPILRLVRWLKDLEYLLYL